MISWIQRSFQQHFKSIFAVLLAVTIISFIMTIGAVPSLSPNQRTEANREFFGYNLASGDDMRQVMNDAALSLDLEYGDQVAASLDQDRLQQMALQRIAALHLANEWHIPQSTAEEQVDFIKTLGKFSDDKGQFDANKYASFRAMVQSNGGSEGEIARVINDEIRSRKVQQLLNGPGYVLPADVMTLLSRSETSWTVGTAAIDFSGYKPTVNPTPAELDKYYKDNELRYQIPTQTLASAVNFQAANYLANVKVTDQEVRAYYDQDPAKFPKPAAADKKPATPAIVKPDPNADFAAVKTQVESALKLERAKQEAVKAASNFAYDLYQNKQSNGPAPEGYAASKSLPLQTLAPFAQQTGPAELGGSPETVEAAAKLDADHPVSDAVATPYGAAVMIWKGTQAARQPAIAEVKAKVLADYTENERRKRIADLGKAVKTTIEARLKAGDTFEKAAAAAAAADSVKIDAKMLPAFTLRDRPADLNPAVSPALEHLDKGQVSDVEIQGDKGTLVYAADKKVPALTPANPQYGAMRNSIASYMARTGSEAYLSDLVSQELKRTAPVAQ